eukprot:comp21199_c0_seq1/m.28796 comp21199_c0_seq1/g.28796  ORF comp21199_c0_seq1/g.28796 comp21199_c0_seq1/m.28796 type:complete len:307 (-) comp21199_c0_seq1:21-941(-)
MRNREMEKKRAVRRARREARLEVAKREEAEALQRYNEARERLEGEEKAMCAHMEEKLKIKEGKVAKARQKLEKLDVSDESEDEKHEEVADEASEQDVNRGIRSPSEQTELAALLSNAKRVFMRKNKGESLGMRITQTSRHNLIPSAFISHLRPGGAASRCPDVQVGDLIVAINGESVVGRPFRYILDRFASASEQLEVNLTVVSRPSAISFTIDRTKLPKASLGMSVVAGEIVSVEKGGLADMAGAMAGYMITEINGRSVVGQPLSIIEGGLAERQIEITAMPTDLYTALVDDSDAVAAMALRAAQ